MTVVLNEAGLQNFFQNPESPLGRLLSRKSQEIAIRAYNHLVPHYRSGLAAASMRDAGLFHDDPETMYAVVLNDAKHPWKGHEPFNYPIALELGGVTPGGQGYQYPFLAPALEESGFTRVG